MANPIMPTANGDDPSKCATKAEAAETTKATIGFHQPNMSKSVRTDKHCLVISHALRSRFHIHPTVKTQLLPVHNKPKDCLGGPLRFGTEREPLTRAWCQEYRF